jgi:hypothetical protein
MRFARICKDYSEPGHCAVIPESVEKEAAPAPPPDKLL